MDLGLQNKIALVTGASRGLGFATALLLAQEGAHLSINSSSPAKIQAAVDRIATQTDSPVLPLPGDLSDPLVPQALVDQTIAAYKHLDILICNTGGPAVGTFEKLDDTAWQKAVELNLLSQVRLIRSALPYLRQSQNASVLTITSISAKQPIANLILSNSLRAAVVALTKSLALELGGDGIRFNSILPAWTETERIRDILGFRAQQNNSTIEEELKKQAQDSPLGRPSTPEEFANAAVFLVSPRASYLTGVMLPVDGGLYKGTF